MRLMRNFGFVDYDRVIYVGTNGKMTEICAAMGLTSLESMDELIATNRCHYTRYAAKLANLPGVRLFRYDEEELHNYHYIILDIDAAITGINRDNLVRLLHAENVRPEHKVAWLIDAAIRKKLRGRPAPGDQGEQVRLYQFLMRQGFSPAGVSSALRKLRTGRRDDQD
jgi:dTDP-4-amino-4,6-dideoxygalactose transaminase